MSDARQELKELTRNELENVENRKPLESEEARNDIINRDCEEVAVPDAVSAAISEDLSRSASLPSFPDSFQGQLQGQGHVVDDQLDEEIKMIVALGEQTADAAAAVDIIDDDVLTFLSKHCS